MIALKKNLKDKKKSFHFRPMLGSRELCLFANSERKVEGTNVNSMIFIEENKVLIQFTKTPRLDKEGRVESDRSNYFKTIIVDVGGQIIRLTK